MESRQPRSISDDEDGDMILRININTLAACCMVDFTAR